MRKGVRLIPDLAHVRPTTTILEPCPLTVGPQATSPTNIALDLLVQREALEHAEFYQAARKNIAQTLRTLSALPRHPASGMFHNRYTPGNGASPPRIADAYLSSVDNLHLAYALWVLAATGPSENRALAARIFSSMQFEIFYDRSDGLFIGGIQIQGGREKPDTWKYRYYGSEARSLYSLSHALGLIRDPEFITKALLSMDADVYVWRGRPLLGLWDGGAFQLLLPRLLISEDRYSGRMAVMFTTYADFLLAEGHRRGLPVPAAHSACLIGPSEYLGKAGNLSLVASQNADVRDSAMRGNWEKVYTPYAAMMAAPLAPAPYAVALARAEHLNDGRNPLYRPGVGWMDGMHVQGPRSGAVVPALLSLDQAMIALAAAQTFSRDGMTVGARALHQNPATRERLKTFYIQVDRMLERSPR